MLSSEEREQCALVADTNMFFFWAGQTFSERVLRHVVFNWLPKSLQRKQMSKDTAYRPQANFLPQAPKRGSLDIIPQRPSKRIEKEKEEAAKNEAAATVL